MRFFPDPCHDVHTKLCLLFSLLLISVICFFCLWLCLLPNGSHLFLSARLPSITKPDVVDVVVGGPIFLRPSAFTPHLPDLSKEMSIFLSSDRPDNLGMKRGEILLQQSQEKKLFASQERIYFSFGEDKILHFSKIPTPLWLELSIVDNEKVDGRAGVGEEKEGTIAPFIISFPMQSVTKPLSLQKQEGICFQKLGKGKWLGEDFRVLSQSTGVKEKKPLQRLEVDEEPLFVREKDWLVYQNERWQKVMPGQSTKQYPLAIVGPIGEQQMELHAFDVEGNLAKLLLNKQSPSPFKTNPEEWISSFRWRSETLLSIGLEKQHFLLHKGSWLFRKEGRWRIVKTPALLDRLGADAFFFFEEAKMREESHWIKGYFFNANGTVQYPLEKKVVCRKKRRLMDTPKQEEPSKIEEKK